ncbi:hypothetical protein BCEN4_1730007 [Burkholderia cenocepacia]|nr:hypothetical protein BCEN4_1730007 [Burkholderia cenocepacia]
MARQDDGRSRMGGRRSFQPRRLRRGAVPVLCGLDAPDRSGVRERDRVPQASARAAVVCARGRRGTAVSLVLSARRARSRLTGATVARRAAAAHGRHRAPGRRNDSSSGSIAGALVTSCG